ncbi:MAG: glycerophosphodiester phosphodiesterase [Patescibacteria group bacterium]
MNDLKIYAHRCGMDDYPENNLESAEKAIENGADGFEVDVRITKDGEPVVFHNKSLINGNLIARLRLIIKWWRLKNEISQMKFKEILRVRYERGIVIEHLADFIKLAEDTGKKIFIEIKTSDHRLIEWLIRTLSRSPVDAVVISFKESDLKEIRKAGIRTGLIVGSLKQVINFSKLFSLKKLGEVYDYVFFGWDPEEPRTKWMYKAALWYLRLRGIMPLQPALRWMVFTGIVKNRKELEYLRRWGFSNIFSDTMKF